MYIVGRCIHYVMYTVYIVHYEIYIVGKYVHYVMYIVGRYILK